MSLTNTTLGMHVLDSSWSMASPAHFGVSETKLIELASQGGAGVIRVPLDLSEVTSAGFPQWQLNSVYQVLSTAANLGIKVILEPGQTPVELSATGTVEGSPGTAQQMSELANRFATLVEQVYTSFPQYADTIAGWEVGNEPNLSYAYYGDYTYYDDSGDPDAPRFWAVDGEQGAFYAQYLAQTAAAIADVEQRLGTEIKVIAAGIAHNDVQYMEQMFAQLRSMNADIDGFTIHPYTFYSYDFSDPASGRPSEWIPDPDGSTSDAWDYYHSFQGALDSIDDLMARFGYGDADLHITEFGVPSFQGYRGAGADGRIDQAKWYAEAFGVIDARSSDNLESLIAHRVLDSAYDWQNDQFNAFDNSSLTQEGIAIANSESAFGLYERSSDGSINAKPALAIMQAVAGNNNYVNMADGIVIDGTSSTINLTGQSRKNSEYIDGYIVMSRGGADQVTGSAYSDSIFAGDGNDAVLGGNGHDRIFGGDGNDTLDGGFGDDDIYGNAGDDAIRVGSGVNRVDGGGGYDTLYLKGSQSQYTIENAGGDFSATSASLGSTNAINVERVIFDDDGAELFVEGDAGSAATIPEPTLPTVPNRPDADDNASNPAAGIQYWYPGAASDYEFLTNGDGSFSVIDGLGRINLLGASDSIWFDAEKKTYFVSELAKPAGSTQFVSDSQDDYVVGTNGDDQFFGRAGTDVFNGLGGADFFDGAGGYNQVNYDGAASDYHYLKHADGSYWVVDGNGMADTLVNIDGLWFEAEDAWYSLDELAS